MAQKIVAGNWKMNLDLEQALQLAKSLNDKTKETEVRVILFPSALFVHAISELSNGKYEVGVQNFYCKDSGAFTGEISISQVKSVGGNIVLIGHSERREYFNESNAFLKEKVDKAIEQGMDFIFCCGENREVRLQGKEFDFVFEQLNESLFHLSADQISGGIIAYEPIWAIGTGETATSAQAEEMHAKIRHWLIEIYGEQVANSVSILYGGSCNAQNAKELFACSNIDGGLIGGAALKVEDFSSIIESF